VTFEQYVVASVISVGLILIVLILVWRMPRRLRRDKFVARWRRLQQRCPDKSQWAQAITEADDLLDEALKKKKYKGKSMGERLVAAQKDFTNNDAVWFGHKLRKKLDDSPEYPLKKHEVQKALFGLRQGLRDIGAL
jgi:hypothetical protein